MGDQALPVLSMRGVGKRFGPITACQDVNLDIHAGQLTAVVGDNGAGKSTIAKVITGVYKHDTGVLSLRGTPVNFSSPMAARLAGVEAVQQELGIAPNLDAVANIFLGREMRRSFAGGAVRMLDERAMKARAIEVLQRLGIRIPKLRGVPVGAMSGGQRQAIAIARAVLWASDVLVLDEPTAALGVRESNAVLEIIKAVLAEGIAVVMISHVLPHVVDLADHVVVMRQGRKVADLREDKPDLQGIISLIVGGL